MATATNTAAATGSANGGLWVYWIMIAVLIAAMYFFSIRPQKKQEKELKNLRDNLQIGDEVLTIGGFYGTIVRIKDDRITIASGAEKTKLELTKNAISTVLNREIPKADAKAQEAEETSKKVSPKNIKKLSKKEETEEVKED